MTGVNILQFGVNGQLARELQRAADADDEIGLQVVPRAEADFFRPEQVAHAVHETRSVDIVVNATAYTAVDKAETDEAMALLVNGEAVGALAAACAARGVPLIHVSTDYVFDGSKPAPYVETDPTAPISAYGRTKLAGETAIRAALPGHVILRTSWVYSAHGINFVKTMLRLGAEREELRIIDDQHGAPTSAADLARAITGIARQLTAGSKAFGTYHYAGGGATTWRGFAEAIFARAAEAGGRRPRVVPIGTADYPTPARRPLNSRLDCGKITRAFGIQLVPWQDALGAVLAELHAGNEQDVKGSRP